VEFHAGEPPKDGEKPPRRKKMRRRERFGTYDKSFEDELDMVPLEQGITHLYNTRGIVDKWLGHPTLDSIFPGAPLDVEILHHVEYDGSFPHCCGRT
jgi:hypothetical protein